MSNDWRKYLGDNLLRNLEKRLKIKEEIIEGTNFFDFVGIALTRKKLTVPGGVSKESLEVLTNRAPEGDQPIEEVWVYNICIRIHGENPDFISATESTIPANTLAGFHDCYKEICETTRNIFWLPFEDVPAALEDSFDTAHWINLDFLRDAILRWRLDRGK